MDSFPFPPYPGAYSDLAVTHYPNAFFLRQEILAHRAIPLWSPTILSGYPFVANPLSGLLYPPGWLALLLPLPAGFHIAAALHLVWGGFGMTRLLRAEGLSIYPTLFGGLAFELMPKIAAHYGAGHLTLVYALTWTPWLLLTWRNFDQDKGVKWKVARGWIKPGLILALIILADVRWAVFACLLWWAYALAHRHNIALAIRGLAFQTGLAALLSAPLLVPLLEYVQLSSRTNLTNADRLAFSLPPTRMLGFIFPDLGGYHEWALYTGALILTLAIIAVVGIRDNSSRKFWIGVVLISLLVSLGSFVPGMATIARLPGFSLLRVPARALFLTGLALIALAGYAIDAIQNKFTGSQARASKLTLVGLASFVLVMAFGMKFVAGRIPFSFGWGVGAILSSVLWIAWGINGAGQKYEKFWLAGLFAIGIMDWGIVDYSYISFRRSSEVLAENAASAEWLASQPSLFRVYSPSYSLPQATSVRAGLQLADGVDPLALESYAAFMERATGVPRQGYSVTIPPFASGDPASSNSGYIPDAHLLGLLNVQYVASAFDLSVDGLEFKTEITGTRLYKNLMVMPRAWVQSAEALVGEQASPAVIDDWQPNRISVDAQGPGLLVLSEVYYPGWRAYVDGERIPVLPVDGLLRGVQLEPGNHRIELIFMPISFYVWLAACIAGLLISFWEIGFFQTKHSR